MWDHTFEIKHNDPWSCFRASRVTLAQAWKLLLFLQPTQKHYKTHFSLFPFICQYTLLPWMKVTWFWCGWLTRFSVINSCCETIWISVQGQVVRAAFSSSNVCSEWNLRREGLKGVIQSSLIKKKRYGDSFWPETSNTLPYLAQSVFHKRSIMFKYQRIINFFPCSGFAFIQILYWGNMFAVFKASQFN